jgi:hypothetical protein
MTSIFAHRRMPDALAHQRVCGIDNFTAEELELLQQKPEMNEFAMTRLTERLEAIRDESTDRLTPVGPDPRPVTRPVHPDGIMPPFTGRHADMSCPGQAVDQRVSAVLFEVIRTMPAEGLTLRGILDRLGERGLLMLCMVLTIPFLLPVSIPGSSIPFGVLIALIAVGLVTHRAPWLPDRLMNRRLARGHVVPMLEKGARLFARLERLIHPRLLPLTHGPTVGRFNGILLGFTGLLMMAPLPLPLSNTLPAYGVLFLALGSVERDGYVVLAGYLMVLLTVGYFSAVGVVGGMGASALWFSL